MTELVELEIAGWDDAIGQEVQARAQGALESGSVLFLPGIAFRVSADEARFLSPTAVSNRKNVSYDSRSGKLKGSNLNGEGALPITNMMGRYSRLTAQLVAKLLPAYSPGLERGRTSFRPVQVSGRKTSWRKDDTRLHVDSFPSSPVQGKRILRVFSNINPYGEITAWHFGEPFEQVAGRFRPALSRPLPGSRYLLRLPGVTKSLRSEYDHLMLRLHDVMKADMEYQAAVKVRPFDFAAGTTWIAFTDQVSYAVVAGQYLLEQTFYLPVRYLAHEASSPLRVLERLTGRRLA